MRTTVKFLTRGGAIALLSAGLALLPATDALAATSERGCTFTPPTPSIVNGYANFTVTVSCGPIPIGYYERQVVYDLVGSDGILKDDVMKWDYHRIDNRGTYTWSHRGWPCNEDLGQDEIYVRVRIETMVAGSWSKAPWVGGPTIHGSCK